MSVPSGTARKPLLPSKQRNRYLPPPLRMHAIKQIACFWELVLA